MHDLKRPRPLAALFGLILICGIAAADEPAKPLGPDDFAYRQPLQVPDGSDGALVRFTLVPSVYRSLTRPDLGDLRVFNAEGKALPYTVLQPVRPETPAASLPVRWFPLPPPTPGQDVAHMVMSIEQQESRSSLAVDVPPRVPQVNGVYLVDLSNAAVDGSPVQLDSLKLDWMTASDLDQSVAVEMSDDLTHWAPIGSTRIVQLNYLGQTLRQDRLDLQGIRARYLRLSWEAGEKPPVLTQVSVRPWQTPTAPAQRLAMSIARDPAAAAGDYAFDAGNPIGADTVQLSLPRGSLLIANVLVRDDPAQPWRSVASGNFFHVMQGATELVNPPLSLGGTVHARYWLVRADPRSSSLQLPPPSLDLAWTLQQVVFLAQPPGPYEVAFGNPAVAPASLPYPTLVPGYDQDAGKALAGIGLAYVADRESALSQAPEAPRSSAATVPMPVPVAAADVTLKPVNPSALVPPAPTPPWQDWRTWLAWGALLFGVGLLAWMAARLVKQMRAAN